MLAALEVLALLDRRLPERAERSYHAATDPRRILPVQGSLDANIGFGILGQRHDLLLETRLETPHQGGAAHQHYIVVQVDLQVTVTLLNRLEGNLSDTGLIVVRLIDAVSGGEETLSGCDSFL